MEAVPLPDLAGPIDWAPLLNGVGAIVHAAGHAHQPHGTDEAHLMTVNAAASGSLEAAAATAGIGRFVLISSIRACRVRARRFCCRRMQAGTDRCLWPLETGGGAAGRGRQVPARSSAPAVVHGAGPRQHGAARPPGRFAMAAADRRA